jgi:hypothetical protein
MVRFRLGRFAVTLRRSIGTALLAGLLSLHPSAPAAAQEDTVLTEAIIQLTIDRGPSEVVPALVYDGTLLLTLRRFLDLTEIRVRAFVPQDTVVVMLEPQGILVRFDPPHGQLTIGDSVIALRPSEAVWSDGDLFVATAVLERVFGVGIRVEWSALTAYVGQTAGLPVIRRERRERQRALLERHAPAVQALDLNPPDRVAGGALLDWSVTATTHDVYTLNLGLGAKLLGGSVELRPQLWGSQGGTAGDFRGSWSRAWPDQQWLQQVRVGDVQSGGRRAYLLRGVVVTNAPFLRSTEFDVQDLQGRLAAGWEAELYDRGRLLAFAEPGAGGTFSMPFQLRYGQNPYDLVLYGPGGEVVHETRTIRVPFSRLPGGRFEYAVGGGACDVEPCDGVLTMDARYGLTPRVTVQGGTDLVFGLNNETLWQPYALASAAILPSLSLTGEAVGNGYLRGSFALEPTPDFQLSFGHTEYASGGQQLTTALIERHRTDGSLFWRPGAMRRTLFFQATGARSTGPDYSQRFFQGSATARLGPLRYTVGGRYDQSGRGDSTTFDRFAMDFGVDAVLSAPIAWLQGATARGVLSIEPSNGLASLGGSIGQRVMRLLRADVGIGWFRGTGLTLDVTLTTAMPGPRATVRNRLSSGGSDGLMYANGSVAWDPSSHVVRWSDGGDLGRAGVTGILYLDANANGKRDAGEQGLAGIPVTIGGWSEVTDATGRFSAWDLFPFETVEVAVDSLAFDDPRYVLPSKLVHVRPTPNSFVAIEVPVIVGAEVSGYVLLDEMGLAGVPVLLRNLDTGAETSYLTYSDGGFYATGVAPGEYEVTLPAAIARQLDVTVPPLSIFIPPGVGERRFENVTMRLERRGP